MILHPLPSFVTSTAMPSLTRSQAILGAHGDQSELRRNSRGRTRAAVSERSSHTPAAAGVLRDATLPKLSYVQSDFGASQLEGSCLLTGRDSRSHNQTSPALEQVVPPVLCKANSNNSTALTGRRVQAIPPNATFRLDPALPFPFYQASLDEPSLAYIHTGSTGVETTQSPDLALRQSTLYTRTKHASTRLRILSPSLGYISDAFPHKTPHVNDSVSNIVADLTTLSVSGSEENYSCEKAAAEDLALGPEALVHVVNPSVVSGDQPDGFPTYDTNQLFDFSCMSAALNDLSAALREVPVDISYSSAQSFSFASAQSRSTSIYARSQATSVRNSIASRVQTTYGASSAPLPGRLER